MKYPFLLFLSACGGLGLDTQVKSIDTGTTPDSPVSDTPADTSAGTESTPDTDTSPPDPLDADEDGDTYSVRIDCDDTDPAIHPDAQEDCFNHHDDDCDGLVDGADTVDCDVDGDGIPVDDGDCDDTDPAIHPGADEICDGIDDNCDDAIDEDAADAPTWYRDDDGDGWGEDGSATLACDAPETGWVLKGSDCDDGNATVWPGATEAPDGADNDCDGSVDEGTEWYDDDGDGYTEVAGDCNDEDAAVSPSAAEVPDNGLDDNCNGNIDEGQPLTTADDDVDYGSVPPDAAIAEGCDAESEWSAWSAPAETVEVPLTVILIAADDGTGAPSESDVLASVADASADFSGMNIDLNVVDVETYANSTYTTTNSADFGSLRADYAATGAVDMDGSLVMFVMTSSDVCGRATFPDPSDSTPPAIMVANGCLGGGDTTAHEIGHYLGLLHTHQNTGWGSASAPESVDGSDCATDGDELCDTPADPARYDATQNPSGCHYSATKGVCTVTSCPTDEHGDTFSPDLHNLMSYYDGCRTTFSADQEQRMLCNLYQNRPALVTSAPSTATSSSMHIVEQRLYLTPDDDDTAVLDVPAGTTCTPLVAWERVIEHPDDQCDVHAQVTEGTDSYTFEAWVEHCGYGNYGSTSAAIARVALLCFEAEGYAERGELTRDGASSGTVALPTAPASQVVDFCGLSWLDGNGDVDFGGTCSTSLSSSGVDATLTWGCEADTKEQIEAWYYLLGVPDDVRVDAEPFFAGSGTTESVSHVYDPAFPDHLAFVIPNQVDTGCDDHGSFESVCTDDGTAVTCSLYSYGSIDGYGGTVLYFDGSFPEATSEP